MAFSVDYFKVNALNSSKLKELKLSPKHFWNKYINQNAIEEIPTEAMQLGTAIHMCVFEPQKFIKTYIQDMEIPECDRRTKEGKEIYKKYLEEYEIFINKNEGKIFISSTEMFLIRQIKDAILNKKVSRILLENGFPEKELYWTDSLTGIACKAKYDWLIEPNEKFINGAFIDLKTTQNASLEEFKRTIYKYGYYNQAAFYVEGMKTTYNTPGYATVIHIAAEKIAPFECAFYALEEETINIGLKENRKLINVYNNCINTQVYPGYEDKIKMIGLPNWALNKFNIEDL